MAQSKMTDSRFTEDDKQLLKKWGKIVTRRIFSVNSFVSINMKKSLLQVMEAIRNSVNPQVCMQQQSVPELLCYLPYLLGFACEAGYLHQIQVNISKPILMVCNTTAGANHLIETISAPNALKKMLLQSKQLLTDSEIASGAHYHSYLITATDSISFADLDIKYDVVVCTTDCLPHLPCRDFSLVIGQETWDPALTGFQIFCSVVLLKYSSTTSITAPSLTGSSGPSLVVYSDMIASKQCPMPQLLEPQIRGIEEMMDRVTDFNCSHIPIELNMCGEKGMKELIYAMPSLLGSAAISNSSCLDLYKPVLFLTTDLAAYQLVSGVLPVILPMECNETTSPDPKELYKCCQLKKEFEVCTFCQQVDFSEVVLTSTEFKRDKSETDIVANSFYKNFHSYNLSAVIIVQTKYLPNKKEQDILYHFRGATTILIRGNATSEKDKEEGNICVVPKILTVQKCSAELISPTLMTHGNDIIERFLLSKKSILTHYQQIGLANIVEWLGSSSKSSGQVAYVTTAIGFKYAAMMLWCLPSMLEWADHNKLIPDGAINLKKPLLVLCINKKSVDEMWNMVHSKSSFHQTSLLRSVNTCSDGKFLSYLATDAESATNTENIAGKFKLIFSHINLLNHLPEAAFSEIVIFKEGQISDEVMNAVTEKYITKSKIVYFNAHQVGPMKKFDLHSDSELQDTQTQEIVTDQNECVTANKTSFITEPAEKSEPKEDTSYISSYEQQVEQPTTFSKKNKVEMPARFAEKNQTPKTATSEMNQVEKQVIFSEKDRVDKPDIVSEKNRVEKPDTEKDRMANPAISEKIRVEMPAEKPLPMDRVTKFDKNLEEETADANITTMPPNLVAEMSDIKIAEIKECNDVKEDIVTLNKISEAVNSLPDKKRKTKLQKILKKKKSKTYKASQLNASPLDPSKHSDGIVSTDHTPSYMEAQKDPGTDTPQLKKTSKWSKCKKFFHNFSPKKRKGRKQISTSPSHPQSASGSLEITEHTSDDHHSTGLFMCWRTRRPQNKRVAPGGGHPTPGAVHSTAQHDDLSTPKSNHSTLMGEDSTPTAKNCGNTENIADGHSGVMTWTDPVIYLTSNRPESPNDCPVDLPEENLEVDAMSFLSICLSDPSSIEIISLTERDNAVVNNVSSAANPLDMNEGDKMKLESNLDLQSVPCVTPSCCVSQIDLQDMPCATSYFERSESHLDLQDISYSTSSSSESIVSLLNTIEQVEINNNNASPTQN